MPANIDASLCLASYHRCHGETRVSTGTHVEVGVGSLCTENRPPSGGACGETRFVCFERTGTAADAAVSSAYLESSAISTARGKADHLTHQGSS